MPKLCVKEYPYKQVMNFLDMVVQGYDDEEIDCYEFVDDLTSYASTIRNLIAKK